MTVRRVLVYRPGSLGDTVVALPCFHLIRRAFPAGEVRVLTNLPVADRAPRLMSVLDGSGLVHGSFEYPVSLGDWRRLWALAREIRRWGPEVTVYLVPRQRWRDVLRDAAFLWVAGARGIVGLPWTGDLRQARVGSDGLCEREAERLSRCLAPLGNAEPRQPANWSLNLIETERRVAREAITTRIGDAPYIVLSPGTKQAANAWGQANWQSLAGGLMDSFTHRLVFVGATDDREMTERMAAIQPERCVNLCGTLSARQAAAAIAGARLFIGADSGPMHLAAAVQTPLVGIFSRLNPPGIWFPFGERVRLLYPYGEGTSILSIVPAQVLAAAESLFNQGKA